MEFGKHYVVQRHVVCENAKGLLSIDNIPIIGMTGVRPGEFWLFYTPTRQYIEVHHYIRCTQESDIECSEELGK